MKSKRLVAIFVSILLVAASFAHAQQPGKISRIGYVSGTGSASNPGPYVEALRRGLRDLGQIEGKNFAIEYRGADGKNEVVPRLVAELIELKVDVLVLPLVGAIQAAKRATKTIPIVMVTQVDPVAVGLVDSLARPGGNITGFATLQRELSGKRLELLKEAVPKLSRVGILRDAEGPVSERPVSEIGFKDYETAARALKIQLQSLGVRGPNPDLEGAFQAAIKARVSAVIAITSNPLFRNSKRITDLAVKNRLPSMFEGGAWVRRRRADVLFN